MTATASAPPRAAHAEARAPSTTSPVAPRVSPQRHLAWLVGGMSGSFLVPFLLADQLGLQRDVYYALYVAAVVGLFVAWALRGDQCVHRDPRQKVGRDTPVASSSSL